MGFSLKLENSDFTLIETTDIPVLVDFWSPNCGFCKMIAPALEDLAESYLGRVWIAKAQAESNSRKITELDISGLPTLVMFKGKDEVGRTMGNQRWSDLKNFIDSYVD